MVEAYEHAAWDTVAALGGVPGLAEAYAQAVAWARARLSLGPAAA
jgi:hypothetical protein